MALLPSELAGSNPGSNPESQSSFLAHFSFFDKIGSPFCLQNCFFSSGCPFCSNFAKQILSRPSSAPAWYYTYTCMLKCVFVLSLFLVIQAHFEVL